MTLATGMTEQEALAAVERLRPVIEHYDPESERERRIAPQVIEAMKSEGLFHLWTPKEYGGAELAFPSYLKVIEELARIDSAAGWMQGILGTSAAVGVYLPQDGANEVYADRALSAGSVIPAGRATPVEGGFRVSGRWPLMSGCHHASWMAGNSLIMDSTGPRMSPHGMPAFTMMIFQASDGRILDTWDSTGMRGTGSADFVVEDVFVPARRSFTLFADPPRLPGQLYKLPLDALFFTGLAVVPLGIARAAIDTFVELAKNKTPTLSQNTLGGRPTVHAEVARAEARLQSARAFMQEVAEEMVESAAKHGKLTDETEARRRLACVNAGEAAEAVVDAMFRLGGSTVIYSGHRLERYLRDIHTVNQHLCVSPVWWEKTGQFYFGLGLGMP